MPRFVMVLILLVAAGVRVYGLDAQSLWNDEGSSYVQATRSFGEIAANAAQDIHPPGYYWTLKVWIGLAGESEFALRFPSVLASLLTVAFAYALGRRLYAEGYGVVTGLVAAGLVALNTFSIFYAQEARMYAALALWGAASLWALAGLMRRPNWRDALWLAVFNALGLWTQYAFPLVMLSQAALVLVWMLDFVRERDWNGGRQLVTTFGGANVLALLAWSPWLPTALRQVTAWPNTGDTTPFANALGQVVGWYTFGITYSEGSPSWIAVMLVLALFGVRLLREATRAAWLPLLAVLVPTIIFFWAGLFRESNIKFLLPSQVAAALMVGQGAAAIWWLDVSRSRNAAHDDETMDVAGRRKPTRRAVLRLALFRLAVLLTILALAINAVLGLSPLYSDEAYARSDYAGIAATIRSELGADDAVVLTAPGQQDVFRYYDTGEVAVFPLPEGFDLADDDTQDAVASIIDEHERIYAVFWGENERDPDRIVETTLDTTAYEISNDWAGDVRLARYIEPPASFEIEEFVGALFGEDIVLEGYDIAPPVPGQPLQVRLRWLAQARLDTRYVVFLQLLDENGQLVAQRDAEPIGGLGLTTTWATDVIIEDHHALILPNDLSDANYTLIMGLYNLNDSSDRLLIRAPAGITDSLELATVTPGGLIR